MKTEWEMKTIGGKDYTFSILPAEYSVVLWAKIVDNFGEAIAEAVPYLFSEGDLDFEEMAGLAAKCISTIDPDKVKTVVDALLPMVMVTDPTTLKGHRCTYDDFLGEILSLYKVIFYCARYNYWDFFSVLLPKGTSPKAQE